MGENTKIEWATHTFNPWIGCTKVSPGCDHCYAERDMDIRRHRVKWGAGNPRSRTSASYWKQPLRWNAKAALEKRAWDAGKAAGGGAYSDDELIRAGFAMPTRPRVFCASLADVFDNEVEQAWRDELFALMRATPNLDWLVLSKRIGNAPKMLPADWGSGYSNVWLGATVINQDEVDRDVPKLLAVPARLRFLSCEPLLGQIDITEHLWGPSKECANCPRDLDCECGWKTRAELGEPSLSWVIVGGESGHGARPFNIGWAREMVEQCSHVNVACFVKQLGANVESNGCSKPGQHWPSKHSTEDTGRGTFRHHISNRKGNDWSEWPEDLRVRQIPMVA